MNDLKVKVGGDTSGFELAMSKVRGQARAMAKDIGSGVANRIAGLFTLGAIEQTIRKTVEYAGQLTDLSARSGVAVESLQRLDKAARENGTSLDSLVGMWERVGSAREDALRDSKGGAAQAFGKFGVGRCDLQTKSPDEIVRKMAAALQNSTNVAELIAPLREIGGRGAGQMIAFFRAGMDQQYQDMQVMSGAQAQILDEMDDKWSTLQQRISIGVAPALVGLIDAFTWVQDKITSFFSGIRGAINMGINGNRKEGFWADIAKGLESGVRLSEKDNKEASETEKKARDKKVRDALAFGKVDFRDIADKQGVDKKEKFSIHETALDDLSKAGLFAGGAGGGAINNYPERQLQATEKLVTEAKRTNDLLEDGL